MLFNVDLQTIKHNDFQNYLPFFFHIQKSLGKHNTHHHMQKFRLFEKYKTKKKTPKRP